MVQGFKVGCWVGAAVGGRFARVCWLIYGVKRCRIGRYAKSGTVSYLRIVCGFQSVGCIL